jgi:hypothetical protein
MRRAQIIGTMAIAATVAAVPVAFAAGGHHHPARVQYLARGVAVSAVSVGPPEALALSDTQFKPSSIGTDGSSFSADLGPKTRFVNHRGRPIAAAKIKTGDRITVVWNEPSTTAFSATLVATRVIDNGPPPPVHYYARGSANGPVAIGPPETLTTNDTQFTPSSIGTAGSTFPADVGPTTKFVNHRGHGIAVAKIKAGDRVTIVWTEPAGTAFSDTLVATKVVDNGPPPPVHYYANGRAAGAVVTTGTPWTLALLKTTFKPASLDSNGPAFTADLGITTKFVGRHGHALAAGSIKTGDRISVTWTEPAGTAFVPTLVATRLVDLSRR